MADRTPEITEAMINQEMARKDAIRALQQRQSYQGAPQPGFDPQQGYGYAPPQGYAPQPMMEPVPTQPVMLRFSVWQIAMGVLLGNLFASFIGGLIWFFIVQVVGR